MSISYPLALPAALKFASIKFQASSVVGMSQSPFTLQQQTQASAGQIIQVAVAIPPMKRAIAEECIAWRLKLNGREGSFLLGDPVGITPRGIATGTPLVNGASQSGNSLITDGWTVGVTNILRAGDWLQLGSGTTARLYKNLNDVNSNGSGVATLDLWPSLRSSPSDNAPIVVASAVGKFMLASNVMEWDIAEAQIYGLQFTAMEDLRP